MCSANHLWKWRGRPELGCFSKRSEKSTGINSCKESYQSPSLFPTSFFMSHLCCYQMPEFKKPVKPLERTYRLMQSGTAESFWTISLQLSDVATWQWHLQSDRTSTSAAADKASAVEKHRSMIFGERGGKKKGGARVSANSGAADVTGSGRLFWALVVEATSVFPAQLFPVVARQKK